MIKPIFLLLHTEWDFQLPLKALTNLNTDLTVLQHCQITKYTRYNDCYMYLIATPTLIDQIIISQ